MGWKYRAVRFRESNTELVNPERGYYQIHTFRLGDDFTMKDREYTLNRTDTIAMVLIDISAYRNKNLDETAINDLHRIFDFFRDYRLDMIVRVVYDTVGRCMETEPENEEQILAHMNQLGPVLAMYSPEIFVYQGLLIGNWGEMHSSKFLSPARLKRLADVVLTELENTSYVAVRRPAYVRTLYPEGEDMRQTRVGIFDDAILASPTHLGTFGETSMTKVRREQSYLPDEEIDYVSRLCDHVPYGGEALWPDNEADELKKTRLSLKKLDGYLGRLHLSYLNRVHDVRFIDHVRTLTWKGHDVYRGLNGYDYIERHLGYRIVIRSTECRPLKTDRAVMEWTIVMENVGYSRVFFDTRALLIARDNNGETVEIDISGWLQLSSIASGERHSFIIQSPMLYDRVYLYVTKASTGRAVYFANVPSSLLDKKGQIIPYGTNPGSILLGTVNH